uniref:SLL1 protein n=1 Tax=Picea sitchensis TaxID=3332 RepID=A9NJS6_PICSI|nr:unknown [Picea sitchensis]
MANVTAASNALKRGLNLLAPSNAALRRPVSRSVHSTGCKKMAEHGEHAEPFYIHAEHMYNLDRMKHQKLKMGLAVWACFGIGVGVPIFAVVFQQKKTASG